MSKKKMVTFRSEKFWLSRDRPSVRPSLVPSRYVFVFGMREDWGLGWGARGLMGSYEGEKIATKENSYFSFVPAHETPRAFT